MIHGMDEIMTVLCYRLLQTAISVDRSLSSIELQRPMARDVSQMKVVCPPRVTYNSLLGSLKRHFDEPLRC